MAQVKTRPLHVLVKVNEDIPPDRPAIAADGGPYTLRGSTPHFKVYYENGLGAKGPTLADAVLATCEAEFFRLQGYFGGITPAGLPFPVYVVAGTFGAYHSNCAATEMHCAAFSGTDANLVRMLVVAEEEEVFSAAQAKGWNCGASHGEGLSRVMATILYPAELDGFATAASWLDGGRPDWVTKTEATDRNYVSIGCATLFLYYLRYQLGLPWAKIVKAGSPTLAGTYQKLTGRTDALAAFSNLVKTRFPIGTPSGLAGTDNPFPISEGIELWSGWQSLGGIIESAPVTVAWAPNRLDSFAIGTDSGLYHRWWNGSAWGGWEALGGKCQSAPSVVSWEPGRLDIFVVGNDSALYHRWWDGAHWGGFESLGGILTSEPCAVSWAPDRLDIFALGEDNACWHRWWNGHSWGGWESLGGILMGPPKAVCWGPNRIDLFGVGTDRALYHRWWDGHSWGGWESLGGVLTSDPTVVSWDEGRLDIFALGEDHACWHRWWDGTSWGGWESLGGVCHSEIAATSWAPNRLDLFTIGSDSALWHQAWDGTRWTGWDSRGGVVVPPKLGAPLSACSWAANRIDAFAIGANSAAWHIDLGAFHIPVKKPPLKMPGEAKAPAAAAKKRAPAKKKAASRATVHKLR